MPMFKRAAIAGTCSIGAGLAVGWWWRPEALPKDSLSAKPSRSGWISAQSYTDNAHKPIPYLLSLARDGTLALGVTLARLWLTCAGDFAIHRDEHYEHFVNTVMAREPDVPLITISNHRSLIDDPTVLSCLLPYHLNIQPKYIRYSLCAQEYCYSDQLPAIVHGVIGMGKVLPILRGAGINQSLLLDYAHLVASGQWCHVFPEGGTWQTTSLGGRSNGREKDIGKLKWGVGKLIAHSPNAPKVIAFYFSGLETSIPQNPITNLVISAVPIPGHKVVVRFSEEVHFADLLAEHEELHGKLWKYASHTGPVQAGDNDGLLVGGERWVSSEAEMVLYSKIARRLETVLTRLNDEANVDLGITAAV